MDETQALSDDDEHEAAKLLLDDQNEVQCRLVFVSDEPNVPKELLLSSGENHIGRAEQGWDPARPTTASTTTRSRGGMLSSSPIRRPRSCS